MVYRAYPPAIKAVAVRRALEGESKSEVSTQLIVNQNAERWSLLPAISIGGVIALTTTIETFQGPQFEHFLEFDLISRCQLGDKLNPIELCFASIKQELRDSQNLSYVADTEWEIRQVAADVMNAEFCYKLYAHRGYCVLSN
ncbi:hypothetical protein PSTG_14910 [Puccinia striiformis f. sp. tritici PST-78]|uniref:Uncharacterized protein n=1 Tax=Puccinia striiformis f. sp. tritici PST-78 TaxID=1165861 RepID=A0A0L0UXN2_9BASI|nr:hypothetical protein PSTG_14910 [Puccinia striiformis f. sp. tritici PST-78]